MWKEIICGKKREMWKETDKMWKETDKCGKKKLWKETQNVEINR